MFGLRVPHAFIEGGSPEVMPLCYTYKSSSPAVQVNSNIRNLFPDKRGCQCVWAQRTLAGYGFFPLHSIMNVWGGP